MAIVVVKDVHLVLSNKQCQPGSWIPQQPAPNPISDSAFNLPLPKLM